MRKIITELCKVALVVVFSVFALVLALGCASAPAPKPTASVAQFPINHRCSRGEYPLMQVQVLACSKLKIKPAVIVLEPDNYKRLFGEYERCVGRKLDPSTTIRLCGVPVGMGDPKKPKEST